MKIKVLFVLGIISIHKVFAILTREQMEQLGQGYRNTCARRVKANMTLVEGIRSGQFIEGDKNLKCYVKCAMGLMKTIRNGKLDLDTMLRQINLSVAEETANKLTLVAKNCFTRVQDAELCEVAWNFIKCMYSGDPEDYFFP